MLLFVLNMAVVEVSFSGGKNVLLVVSTFWMMLLIYLVSRVRLVGITGGIGCGKSTVSQYLVDKYRLRLIDCDMISRSIYLKGQPAYDKVVDTFGVTILDDDE